LYYQLVVWPPLRLGIVVDQNLANRAVADASRSRLVSEYVIFDNNRWILYGSRCPSLSMASTMADVEGEIACWHLAKLNRALPPDAHEGAGK
jgi:hypothetical protein